MDVPGRVAAAALNATRVWWEHLAGTASGIGDGLDGTRPRGPRVVTDIGFGGPGSRSGSSGILAVQWLRKDNGAASHSALVPARLARSGSAISGGHGGSQLFSDGVSHKAPSAPRPLRKRKAAINGKQTQRLWLEGRCAVANVVGAF